MAWNAKSHAANHGYSHLSGIEIMCLFTMWNHSLFRIVGAFGRAGSAPCSSSHLFTSKPKYCLLQSIPAKSLSHDAGCIGANPVRSDASIELIRIGSASSKDLSKLLPERID